MSSNYTWMENHLQEINRLCIQIKDENRKNNIEALKKVLDDFTKEFKKDDEFKEMYSTNFYAGSVWDKIKISNADEYDIDLLLTLPKLTKPIFKNNNSIIDINLSNMEEYEKQYYSLRALKRKFLNENNNLCLLKVNSWFESLVQKAINTIKPTGYEIKRSYKSGPAKTLSIKTAKGESFDVDLVPSFLFTAKDWPEFCKPNPGNQGFIIVPKLLTNDSSLTTWRLSFQEQERKILYNKENMKSALRLIKRLRDSDSLFTNIKSYYIKSIFLLEIEQNIFIFERKPLSTIFMHMLRRLQEYITSGKIPYFWIPTINLLKDCKASYLQNLGSRLAKIIKKLEDPNQDENFLKSIFIKQ